MENKDVFSVCQSAVVKYFFASLYRKSGIRGSKFALRWAVPEDFMQLAVMPRMILDHLPENVEKVLDTILQKQQELEHQLH